MDKISLSESERVLSKYIRIKTVGLTLGYLEPFLDKGPVGPDPDRIRQSRLDGKLSTRGSEDPLAFGVVRLVQDRSAAGGGRTSTIT